MYLKHMSIDDRRKCAGGGGSGEAERESAERRLLSGQFSKLDIFHHCRVMSVARSLARSTVDGRARLLTTTERRTGERERERGRRAKEKIPTSKTDRFSVKFKRSRSGNGGNGNKPGNKAEGTNEQTATARRIFRILRGSAPAIIKYIQADSSAPVLTLFRNFLCCNHVEGSDPIF